MGQPAVSPAHAYRLRQAYSGRRRLNGQPSGGPAYVVAVPGGLVSIACLVAGCPPNRLALVPHWDDELRALVYVPLEVNDR